MDKGERKTPLSDRPTDVPDPMEQSWEEYWLDEATDAGLTRRSDANGFVRWLKAAKPDSSLVAGEDTRAASVMARAVLSKHGITASTSLLNELTINEREFDQGNELVQSTCFQVICMIYMLELPGVEDVEWFKRLQASPKY